MTEKVLLGSLTRVVLNAFTSMKTLENRFTTRRGLFLLFLLVLTDIAHPCILLLNGWKQMSVGERAYKVQVVFVGKVAGLYAVDPQSQFYAADFEIIRILKGEKIIDEVLSTHPGPTVKVYGFGEKSRCYSEVYKGEIHILFMLYEPKSRSLVARYETAFAATSPATVENENEVLLTLGWKAWSSWSTCTKSCDGGLQWRTRQCAQNKCEGFAKEGRRCNFFKCYGIKNVGQYFSPQPNRVMPLRTRTRIARHVTLQGATALSLPTSKVFQYYFPDEYSISVTFRPVQYTDIYLLALYDFANNLQFGIRLASGFLTFELAKSTDSAHRQWSLDFDVEIALNTWHSATFSLQTKQITMFSNCQKAGSKSLPGRFTFAPDHSGTIHLGKPFYDYEHGQKNIEIDELYFIPDVDAAKQQCYNPTFSSKMSRNIAGSGYFPGEDGGEGSGISNYIDDDEVETEWTEWSPCSRTCGKGVRRRVMMCANLDDGPPGKECLRILQNHEEKSCNLQDCPGHCSQPCLNGGFCTSQNKCRCKAGYHGDTCNKVSCKVKCFNGGRCVGPNTCKCKEGYTGKQCQKPICSSPCQNGGSCIRPNVCKCQPGYLPPNCRAACVPACINGGRCVDANTCLCTRGFQGSYCEKAYCSRPCLNGGNCYAPNACSCSYGWYGSRCEKARCLRKCQNGGKCVRPNMCMCPRGLYGFSCQYKVKY